MRRSLGILMLVAACCGWSTRASAQAAPSTVVIIDSSKISWTASPDDAATFGTPPAAVVTSYRADVYLKSAIVITGTATAPIFTPSGGAMPVLSIDQGKPTPDASGTEVGPTTLKASVQPNTEYVVFMRAVGPGGVSALSSGAGPFGFPGPPRPAAGTRIMP